MNDSTQRPQISGGRFDFEDGGTFCGGWDDGKAHGHGVCTGPKHQGAYAGAWNYGFEVSGAYIWPSGSHYEGQWQNGRRHGLGVEQIGRQIYRGEWSKDGHKGRYGVRQSTVSTAKYEGTWNMGYQDGYGCETYADGGKYQGQWQEGKRHGYGIRTSAPFGLASHYRRKDVHASLNSLRSSDIGEADKGRSEEIRGGFVLTAKSDKLPTRRNSLSEKTKKGFLSGFKMRKQKSTGDLEKRGTVASSSVRSTASTSSWASTGSEQSNLTTRSTHTDSNASFTMEDEQLDAAVTETYMGEWKKDRRCGHGVAERSDGLKYEGEWYNNKKHGYGVTTFRDGTFEEGKYKNNILITSQKKKHLFLARSRKFRDRIAIAVNSAQRALKMAMQRSDIAISRTSTASDRAQSADIAADQARLDCEIAVRMAREFAPDFKPSVLERFEKLRFRNQIKLTTLVDNSLLSPYSGNEMALMKNGSVMKDLKEKTVTQTPNSIHAQNMQVTPQTDFAGLISQPNQPGNTAFNQSYASRAKNYGQQGQQYEDQQQSYGQDFNTTTNNSNIPYGRGIQENEITANYNSYNQTNTGNYPMRNTADQLDGYRYNTAERESNAIPRNPQSGYNEQQVQSQSMQALSQQNSQYGRPQPQPMQPPMQTLPQQNSQYGRPQPPMQTLPQQNSQYGRPQPQPMQPQMQTLPQQNSQYGRPQPQPMQPPMQTSPQQNSQFGRPQPQQNEMGGERKQSITHKRPPPLGETKQQLSIDYFDHYKRPPSRDSSTDRYARAGSVLNSRQPSADRSMQLQGRDESTTNREVRQREGSRNLEDNTSRSIFNNNTEKRSSLTKPFEDVLLHQRNLGQDIIPSPITPKRTESLYIPANVVLPKSAGSKPVKSTPINVSLQRKKSLPDFQELPRSTEAMSREEVSALGSARREAVRRQIEINERLKANPLLYIFSPQVKDWLSSQQLVLFVLFLNILLGYLFLKMLT
ncbi:uncharacterized protein LOC101460529 isoform X2 [Ceratitis capitata]|nr:uncharacterized protein LOC101460529 isoform X2 [Ceratitis capitata]XP_012162520.1 uncharacterized protein LOC101460529 isoform X2 [Ceratitis capitata]